MDIQQKQQEIEAELLATIIEHLKKKQLDVATASQLAKDFLNVLPLQNQADLLAKLKNLSDTYVEAKQLYTIEAAKGQRAVEQEAVEQMNQAIKNGNIEQALSVAQSLKQQSA